MAPIGDAGKSKDDARTPDLRDYWRIIFRGRWYIIVSFVVIIALTAFFTFTAKPVYEASAKILIEQGKTSTSISGLFSPSGIGSKNDFGDRIQVIRSRPVLEAAQAKLEKNEQFVALRRGKSSSRTGEKDSPLITPGELAARLTVRGVPGTDIIEVRATGSSPLEAKLIANAIVEAYQEKDTSLARKAISSTKNFLAQQLKTLEAELELSEKQSMEFQRQVGLELGEAGVRQKLTQLTTLYIQAKVNLENKKDQLNTVNKFLDDVKGEIFGKEISGQGSDIILEIEDKLAQLKKFQADLAKLEASRAKYIEEGNYLKAQALENEILQKKAILEKAAMTQFTALRLLPQYEDLIKKQLDLYLEVETYKNRVQVLEQMMASELQIWVKHGLELARLNRNLDVSKDIYTLLRENFEKARISEAGELGAVRIVNWAEGSGAPISPKKKQNLILAGLIGLTLGIGLAFVRDHLDNTYKTGKEVEDDLGIPVLGTFFSILPRLRGKEKGQADALRAASLARFDREWEVFDTYAAIEAQLRYVDPDRPLRLIGITSAVPEEGKTTVVTNLGLISSETGRKTLVVDSDLRKGIIDRMFELERDKGLTNLALGEIELSEALKRPYLGEGRPVGRELDRALLALQKITPAQLRNAKRLEEREALERLDNARSLEQILIDEGFIDEETLKKVRAMQREKLENFYVLPAGTRPLNPGDFLGSKSMEKLLEELKSQFDITVFDTSPVTVAPDASLLCRMLDGVILIVEARKTPKEVVKKAVSDLQQAGARVIGIILNKMEKPSSLYYGYGKYGYSYGYGYGHYGHDGEKKGGRKAFWKNSFARMRSRFHAGVRVAKAKREREKKGDEKL